LEIRATGIREPFTGATDRLAAVATADDLFGGPEGSPRTDKLIAASIQWAEVIMAKIDERFPAGGRCP